MGTRTLVIAIDAGDPDLFETCRYAERLPCLDELASTYGVRQVAYTDGVSDDCLWASFQYSLPPGGHGRYFWKRDTGVAGFEYCDTGEHDLPAFWEPLAGAGHRVAVFDLPKTRLTCLPNGLHLANWLVHGRYGNHATSWPPNLAQDVTSRFGGVTPSLCSPGSVEFPTGESEALVSTLRESIHRKKRASLHYLAQQEWDLFMTSFKEMHCASHLLWPSRPGEPYESIDSDRADHAMSTLFSDIDGAIADLVNRSGACTIVVFSTTGMTGNRSINHLAAPLMQKLNSCCRRDGQKIVDNTRPVATRLPYNEDTLALRIDPDHAKSTSDIGRLLGRLRDRDSGRALFSSITYPSTEWPGTRSRKLPDILAHIDSRNSSPVAIVSDDIGTLSGTPEPIRAGNHGGDGFAIVSAPMSELLTDDRIELHDIGVAIQSAFDCAR